MSFSGCCGGDSVPITDWTERRKAVAFVAIVVVAIVALFWAAAVLYEPNLSSSPGTISVGMRMEGSTWVLWYNATATANTTAFVFLLEASAARGFAVTWTSYGPPLSAVLVVSINGDANGQDGRYWQFWVDGRYSGVGADHAVLRNGAFVEWRFAPAGEG